MDLEELKVIWNSQNREPLFTLNEANLHAVIQRRTRESNRCAACRYRAEISLGTFCGILMLAIAGILAFGQAEWLAKLPWPKVASSPWDVTALLMASGIWFYFALYLNRARLRLQRSGETFESTLRGDIDRALTRVEFQIKIAKDIVWWGFIPAWVALTLGLLVVFRLSFGATRSDGLTATYVMATAVMIAAFIAEVSCRRNAIRNRYEPHQRELESLRRKLADPQR